MHDAIVIGGGQSGLAAARALLTHGVTPLVLESGREPVGSWPRYYDSLTAFSPVAFSAMPGLRFDGDPDHYPHRDEVVAYLRRYARSLDVEIRPATTVTAVEHREGFIVHTDAGETLAASSVVAASGSFGTPYVPALAGQDAFSGRQLHVADYDNSDRYAGQRVLVVGGGNSAVQVAYELAQVASVSLATRRPIVFFPQILEGRDVHHWLTTSGFDRLPRHGWRRSSPPALSWTPVTTATPSKPASWTADRCSRASRTAASSGPTATAKPSTPSSTPPATDPTCPISSHSAPSTPAAPSTPEDLHHPPRPRLVGLEFQRSFASNTLRGVHRDAEHVAAPLAAFICDAPPRSAYDHAA